MSVITCTILLILMLLWSPWRAAAQDAVGQPVTRWLPGTLDIHHISTGRGNAALFLLPDGTTLMVDAGAVGPKTPRHAPARPDESRTPGQWLARYLQRVLPAPELDYFLLTHFHEDHMGYIAAGSALSKSGAYKLGGLTEVGEQVRIRTLLDRNWPDYDFPAPLKSALMENYRAFLKWHTGHSGMSVERFAPGRADQIVLRRSPEKFPSFQIRNIAANGEIWTGVETATRRHFPANEATPAAERPSENMCSIVFRLSYGRFDYYSGGDIPGVPFDGSPSWHDVETPVAQAVGPVEVAQVNHHGYLDTQNAFFVGALRPRVWLIPVWDAQHPTQRVYFRLQSRRIYPGPRDIFATNMHDANRVVLSGVDRLASDRGHVVVRVAEGGHAFRVVVLDDSAESHRVVKVMGPYTAN